MEIFYLGLRTAAFLLPSDKLTFSNSSCLEKKNSVSSGGGSWFRGHTECKSSFLGLCLRHANVPQVALV